MLLLVCFFCQCFCFIHKLHIEGDNRDLFKVETFGFLEGGTISLDVSGFSFHKKKVSKDASPAAQYEIENPIRRLASQQRNATQLKLGFVLRKFKSEEDAQEDLEYLIDNKVCLLEKTKAEDFVLDLTDSNLWPKASYKHEIQYSEVGLYSLIFCRCGPDATVGFHLDAVFANPGPNYLSAGDINLPTLYLVYFFLFSAALALWSYTLVTSPKRNAVVHRIHYMMTALLVLKCLSLLFESVRFHYLAIDGIPETWDTVYFLFAFLKGIMLFTVILLIGSGWSLMKSYLNAREKQIIFIVLILQVLDNVAMIVLEETSPGSQVWLAWRDVLHLVDIACCCAILFPIVWSINHLRQAAETDGKANANMVKLQLFRQFYIIVVAYIYFTRIVVYLISASVSYEYLWLGDFSSEGAALAFYLITGYKFRPQQDNPYIPVQSEEAEALQEFGLSNENDFEMVSTSSSHKRSVEEDSL